MGDREHIHVWVTGKVQGVGFRYFVEAEAVSRRLCGTVRNVPDGRVEIELEGPLDELQKMLERVRVGPSGARVSDVQVDRQPYKGRFSKFLIQF